MKKIPFLLLTPLIMIADTIALDKVEVRGRDTKESGFILQKEGYMPSAPM